MGQIKSCIHRKIIDFDYSKYVFLAVTHITRVNWHISFFQIVQLVTKQDHLSLSSCPKLRVVAQNFLNWVKIDLFYFYSRRK